MAYNEPGTIFYSYRELRAQGFVTDRKTLSRRIDRGQFPAPIKIGGSLRWSRDEIDKWLAKRLAERAGQ
jgi:predicted DNA-binding transcriptional regulator AlpA